MALSGSWTGGAFKNNGGHLRLDWDATQNIPENYSRMTARLYLVLYDGTYIVATEEYSIWVAGEQFAGGSGGRSVSRSPGTHLIHTITKVLYHENDGSRHFPLGATFNSGWGNVGYLNIGDRGFYLDVIPRVSNVSLNTGYNPPWNDAQAIGKGVPIYTNRKSSSFTHTLEIQFGTFSKVIASNVGDSYTWNTATDATSLYAQIPNETNKVGWIVCKTYYGQTYIGQSKVAFRLEVDKSISSPLFTAFSVVDTNTKTINLTGNSSTLIQGVSTMKITINAASPKNGASIVGYRVTQGSTSVFENKLIFESIIPTDTSAITVTAVDSRGFETKLSKSTVIYAYQSVSIQSMTTLRKNRTDVDVDLTSSIKTTPIIINNKNINNEITYRWRYKESSSSTYGAWSAFVTILVNSSGNALIERYLGNIYETGKSYNVQIEVYDKATGTWYGTLINKGIPLIAFKKQGVGINVDPGPGLSLDVGGNHNISGRLSIKGNRSNAVTMVVMLQQIVTVGLGSTTAQGNGTTFPVFNFSHAYALGGGWNWSNSKATVPNGTRFVRAALQISVQRLTGLGYAYMSAFLLHKRADGTAIRYICRGTSCAEVNTTSNMHLQVGASQIVPSIINGDYFETYIYIWSVNASTWQINGQQAQASLEVLDYE